MQIGIQENGKPKYKNVYAHTIKELEEKAAAFRSELEKGIVVDDMGLTVGEWAIRWLELYKGHLQHTSKEVYRIMIDAHITPAIGSIKIKNLKTHHVQELINSKLKTGSTRTAEKIKLTLNQIIKQAIMNEYIYKDIMIGVKMPKKTKSPKRALSDEEITMVTGANLTPKEKTFVHMLLYTGVRRGEILALTRNDIDFKNKTLSINKSVFEKNGRYELKPTPKTQAGFRSIPLIDELIELLKEYNKECKNLILFPSTKGELMTISSFRRFWEGIIKKIEIESTGNEKLKNFNANNDVLPHIFRHTYATKLFYAGIDIKAAQYFLGHSSIQVTMDIYTHLENNSITGATEKLNSFFKKIEQAEVTIEP